MLKNCCKNHPMYCRYRAELVQLKKRFMRLRELTLELLEISKHYYDADREPCLKSIKILKEEK